MGKIFIVPKKVYETGMKYEEYASKLIDMENELEDIKEQLEICFQGVAAHDFIESFKVHKSKFKPIYELLGFESQLLKDCAINHSKVDNSFYEVIERSDIDDQFKGIEG